MRMRIAAIGRMKSGPERDLCARYIDRLKKTGPPIGLEWSGLSEFPEARDQGVEDRKRNEAERLSAITPDGARLIVLDERGKTLSSEEFAQTLRVWRDEGARDCALLLGGPDGHDAPLRESADLALSLGRLTFPHQIARILVAEQLYRAVTILAGHPYHRV